MTHDKSLFKELDKTYISKIKIGNGDYIAAKGKGNVAINCSSVKMKEESFALDMDQTHSSAYHCLAEKSHLWHKRLGHFHYSCLSYLGKMKVVEDFPNVDEGGGIYEVCQLGKQPRFCFHVQKLGEQQRNCSLFIPTFC